MPTAAAPKDGRPRDPAATSAMPRPIDHSIMRWDHHRHTPIIHIYTYTYTRPYNHAGSPPPTPPPPPQRCEAGINIPPFLNTVPGFGPCKGASAVLRAVVLSTAEHARQRNVRWQ